MLWLSVAGVHTRAPPFLWEDPQASRLTNPCSGSELPTPPPESASEGEACRDHPDSSKGRGRSPVARLGPNQRRPPGPQAPGSFLRRGRGSPSTPLSWERPDQVRGARLTHLGAEARAREHTQSPGGEAVTRAGRARRPVWGSPGSGSATSPGGNALVGGGGAILWLGRGGRGVGTRPRPRGSPPGSGAGCGGG